MIRWFAWSCVGMFCSHPVQAAGVTGWVVVNPSTGAATTKPLSGAATNAPILGNGAEDSAAMVGLYADINGTVDGRQTCRWPTGKKSRSVVLRRSPELSAAWSNFAGGYSTRPPPRSTPSPGADTSPATRPAQAVELCAKDAEATTTFAADRIGC